MTVVVWQWVEEQQSKSHDDSGRCHRQIQNGKKLGRGVIRQRGKWREKFPGGQGEVTVNLFRKILWEENVR